MNTFNKFEHIDKDEFEKLEAKRAVGKLASLEEQQKLINMYKQINKNKAKERSGVWRMENKDSICHHNNAEYCCISCRKERKEKKLKENNSNIR